MSKKINPDAAVIRGYLVEDYRVFHINSMEREMIPPHFHGFHKLIFLMRGELSYVIEGSICKVEPGQLLLVPAFSIHQPLIGPDSYERTVIWIDPEAPELTGLEAVFLLAQEDQRFVLMVEEAAELIRVLSKAEKGQFGTTQLRSAMLTQLLVYAGRELQKNAPESSVRRADPRLRMLTDNISLPAGSMQDEQMGELIRYINGHLTKDLSAASLARRFYLSESGLGKRFRKTTGCSVHQFVLQKRLIYAARLIRDGKPFQTAAESAGFTDYSSFYRAFVRYFDTGPRDFSVNKKRNGAEGEKTAPEQ